MSVAAQNQNEDIRWRQRFQNFRKAFAQLSAACDLAQQRTLSNLEQQGLIQAFEFTHELAWNTLKDFLEHHGAIGIYGSKDAPHEAFAKGLIEDGELWMAMIQSRNRTTDTYDEATANEIARAITSKYRPAFSKFETRFVQLDQEEK
jgi:nucleotidyltransferase substrate binding protein (TIGR01987 family)